MIFENLFLYRVTIVNSIVVPNYESAGAASRAAIRDLTPKVNVVSANMRTALQVVLRHLEGAGFELVDPIDPESQTQIATDARFRHRTRHFDVFVSVSYAGNFATDWLF